MFQLELSVSYRVDDCSARKILKESFEREYCSARKMLPVPGSFEREILKKIMPESFAFASFEIFIQSVKG